MNVETIYRIILLISGDNIMVDILKNHLEPHIPNKWPQMIVTGTPVTMEQAKDIIRRTDDFFVDFSKYAGGNNHNWNEWAGSVLHKHHFDNSGSKWKTKQQELYKAEEEFKTHWGHVYTEYVNNTWASCAFIGGPHGWCHPDGRMVFTDNVGKWPSFEEVVDDWKKLLEAFPYINVGVTLFNGESSEQQAEPICSLKVGDNKIEYTMNHNRVHVDGKLARHVFGEDDYVSIAGSLFTNPLREQGLPDIWIEDFGEMAKEIYMKMGLFTEQ